MTKIPAHIDRYSYSEAQLAAEYKKGDRVIHIDSDRKDHKPSPWKSLESGVVIAVARRKEVPWREQFSSWIGQQIVLIRWDNGTEGGTCPDSKMLKWQPAYTFQKVQAQHPTPNTPQQPTNNTQPIGETT